LNSSITVYNQQNTTPLLQQKDVQSFIANILQNAMNTE